MYARSSWILTIAAIAIAGLHPAAVAAASRSHVGRADLERANVGNASLIRPAAQQQASQVDRIRTAIDDRHTVSLPGNTHPFAQPIFATGRLAPESRMEKMILVLQSAPGRQRALDAFLADLSNPASPKYHQWLTPASFAKLYGVSAHDLDRISLWLISAGFTVDEVPASHRLIVFSGTAGQVENAFHTEMHTYSINGKFHLANATSPRIPAALAGVVSGVATLHDFRHTAMHSNLKPVDAKSLATSPQYNVGTQHFISPADCATIYDVDPLYNTAINGTGQSIAIAGRSNIKLADVEAFRQLLGLPENQPVVTIAGTDPGTVNSDDEVEADLDVEWAGAVAKNASIHLVTAASTGTTDGIDIAAQYIVNNNVASVMSTSYGSCEAAMGSAERSFYSSLWQQAAAQGITTLVASGDSGSAACDLPASSAAHAGAAVNGLCSTANNVCVGGTQLVDTTHSSLYWSGAVNPTTYGSALSYIPEAAWNESAASAGGRGLYSTGGGSSAYVAKPAWQSGAGVPSDGQRDVPDVSLTSATHDGYLIYAGGALAAVGGTSAAAPAFAGLMALINQSLGAQSSGARVGNANPILYSMAAQHPSVFHDITSGNNSVPGATGYSAGAGYDLATGLGSVDAAQLASLWSASTAPSQSKNPPAISLAISSPSLAVVAGSSQTVQLTVSGTNGFNSNVVLSASALPAGMQTTLQPTVVSANGIAAVVITTSDTLQAGSYSLVITGSGGGLTTTVPLTISVAPRPYLALTTDHPSLAVRRGTSGKIAVSTSAVAGFNAPVSLYLNGAPRRVTTTISTSSIAAPGDGTVVINISAGTGAVRGKTNLILTTVGAGVTQMYLVPLTVY